MCRSNTKFYVEFLNVFSLQNRNTINGNRKGVFTLNIEFSVFLHILLKFEVIWTRIDQIIRISIFLKHPTHLKWYKIFWNIIYHYYLLRESFKHQRLLVVFHWSLSDSKSPQVSRTLLSILAYCLFFLEIFTPALADGLSLEFEWQQVSSSIQDSSQYSSLLFIFWEFYTPALADGLSLEFEWLQVSSILRDSSQYSGRSQQFSSLDGLPLLFYFQVI